MHSRSKRATSMSAPWSLVCESCYELKHTQPGSKVGEGGKGGCAGLSHRTLVFAEPSVARVCS
jgi:hypothetical protein